MSQRKKARQGDHIRILWDVLPDNWKECLRTAVCGGAAAVDLTDAKTGEATVSVYFVDKKKFSEAIDAAITFHGLVKEGVQT